MWLDQQSTRGSFGDLLELQTIKDLVDPEKCGRHHLRLLHQLSSSTRTHESAFLGNVIQRRASMLDCFEIATTSGVVVWSRHNIPIGSNVVNSLINDVFIEEKARPMAAAGDGRHPAYKVDKYTLKYTLVKDLGLIFVVCATAISEANNADAPPGRLSVITTSYMGR